MSVREPTEFGWWLQERMDAKQLSQTDLAALIDVSQATISRWTFRDLLPDPTKLARLADVLELTDVERAEMYRKAGHTGVAEVAHAPAPAESEPLPEELVKLRRMLLSSSALGEENRAELRALLNAVMAKYEPMMAMRRRRGA